MTPIPARICLLCGAEKPCMTETDLKPGDPGVPCTFDPTPQELYAENIRLRKLLESTPAQAPAAPSTLQERLREVLRANENYARCMLDTVDLRACIAEHDRLTHELETARVPAQAAQPGNPKT